ncbi:MAG TPA: DUF547 domain-containing protein [Vicinamibacterales bacterium]|nr:DUF547 domain-containing protein [Vicinamibacterales bacterium]
MQRMTCAVVLAAVMVVSASSTPGARQGEQTDRHTALDRILDVYVRDGYVYYKALKASRAPLDQYVTSLDVAPDVLARMTENERRAFWINAYNAIVLRTVINAYPIQGKAAAYPASSVGQLPGAFDKIKHRVAGQVLTLDEIENLLAGLGDARLLLALGRGTIGSARLRSEVYRGARLDEQLNDAVKGFVRSARNFSIDRDANTVKVTPLLGWRGPHFIAGFASAAGSEVWANRSPIERAVAAMAFPYMFPSEKALLTQNTFQMTFGEYDWRLNDLTGGIPE